MVNILFGNDSKFVKAKVEKFETQSGSIGIRLIGEIPNAKSGFKIYSIGKVLIEDCTSYDTIYRSGDGFVEFCNDKTPYEEPQITEPEPIVVPELTKEEKEEIEKQNRIYELQSEISELKLQLSSKDYIIIKLYEMSLVGETTDEYNVVALHTEREELRSKINQLEIELLDI